MAELGFKDYEVDSWYAMFVPAKTPQPIIDALYKATVKVLAEPAVKESCLHKAPRQLVVRPLNWGQLLKLNWLSGKK